MIRKRKSLIALLILLIYCAAYLAYDMADAGTPVISFLVPTGGIVFICIYLVLKRMGLKRNICCFILAGLFAVIMLCIRTYARESTTIEPSSHAFYTLPFICDYGTNKKVYETVSIQAASSGGTLTVTMKNTGKKDVILRSAGVHIRLYRTPFYVIQGKKKMALSLPGHLKIAAGEELHLSCPVNNIGSDVMHVGFVSLVVVGERVYDGLPEREVPIQRK